MARTKKIEPGKTLVQPFELTERKLPTDKPVVQYIRQSTRKQKKNNRVSNDMQDVDMKNRLIAYKWSPELILPAISTDTGHSGTKGWIDRDGLANLYRLIDTGGVGTVAAHNVSRIYRSLSKAETGKFCDLVLERGVPVVTSRRIYWPTRDDNTALAADFQAAADWIEDHVKGVMIAAKNYHIQNDISYAGHSIPFGFVVDDIGNEGAERKFYRVYELHAEKIRWLFKRYRELSGNLPLLARELKEIDFRFPAFEPGIPVHVGLRADEDGTYPLRQRAAIIGILTNRSYIGWQVYNGVIVSREAHTAIVGIEDFMYAWERLSKVSLDGTEEQETAVRERRYGGRNALLDGVLRSNELPVYVVKDRYVASAKNDGFNTYDMLVPVKTIDSAFAKAMVATLASLELAHRRGLQEELYQRVAELQKAEEKHVVDYQESIARVDKEIKSQEMAQRISREEGDEQGYRDATKQLVLLRKDKSVLEAKAKQSSSELSELKECGNLIECAIQQWSSMKIWQQKKLVKLTVSDANTTEVSPHFLKLDVFLYMPVKACLTVYIYRSRGSRSVWSEEDIALLRDMYPTASKQAVMEAIPLYGWDAMRKKADDLGILRNKQPGDVAGGKLLALSYSDLQLMQEHGAQLEKPVWSVCYDEEQIRQFGGTIHG